MVHLKNNICPNSLPISKKQVGHRLHRIYPFRFILKSKIFTIIVFNLDGKREICLFQAVSI
jgi:hypothetical protein